MIVAALNLVIPLVARWVEAEEGVILERGVALSAGEAFDAHLAGVREPGKVRLMRVERIPAPGGVFLKKANEWLGLISPLTAGLTLGYGIYIRSDVWGDRALVVHECVHVGQYERLGTVGFLREYLGECLTMGYPNGPLEQEAVVRAREICG